MTFNNPWVLTLLLLVPLYFWWNIHVKKSAAMKYSSINQLQKIKPSLTVRLRFLPLFLRCLVLILIIISVARPQKSIEHSRIPIEGIDIMLGVDVSTSMLAEDFTLNGRRTNRLAAVKDVIEEFISKRKNDRIGMVVFAGYAYTQCPLTIDYGILLQFLEQVKIGMIEDGTAIGSALVTCLNRIKDVPAKSKIIILLTDGRNNTGKIDPLTAAEMAESLGVKVYTIGAGSRGPAPYPVKDMFGNKVYRRIRIDIDEETLKRIADITGGMYFRATDTRQLEKIYNQINKMEKRQVEAKIYTEYKELFVWLLIPALIILLSAIILENTWLRKLP